MKKALFLIICFSLLGKLSGQFPGDSVSAPIQLVNRTKNLTGFSSLGWKNTYGVWGVFYGRRISLNKTQLELRIGCGIRDAFVIGGGTNLRVYTNQKRFEMFIATDYSYNFPGIIRFDDEKAFKPYSSDQYSFTKFHYLHSYLAYRIYDKDRIAAWQLKTGYTFLLNTINVQPFNGPNISYAKAVNTYDNGITFAIDLILYIRYFEDFKKVKRGDKSERFIGGE